jgi:TolB-like protein/DNA-binding winged helix-turn-helix (wHTH) protein/Tfp pilus assembly protein PilF
MKSFQSFRLDTANQCLWRQDKRVPIPAKAYDVLRYLVENPGRLVTQDEFLDKLWPDTYVNPELIRKYILDIRQTLGDRPEKPRFIETVTKRGYRFIAPVIDLGTDERAEVPTSDESRERIQSGTIRSGLEASSHKRTFWKLPIIAVLVIIALVLIGGVVRQRTNGAHATLLNNPSIAVLPFVDMSPAKDQEYVSDGLAEELIHHLSRVSGLKVVGRSSAFQFKGRNEDLRAVGRKLGVANVLEGSVRRDGNHIRVTAELIKAEDGFQLWSQTYDREISDIFAVQDEIARGVTQALQAKLVESNGQPLASSLRSSNPEAYRAYLQANYFLGRGLIKEELEKALAYADQAVELDKEYAPAWASRATIQTWMAMVSITDVTEGFRKARDDAERAIALDPTSASGYVALARTQTAHDWDWDTASTCLTKAAGLEPGNVEILRVHSWLSAELGNLDDAVKFDERAIELDPLRSDAYLELGYELYAAGRYREARSVLQQALDLNPNAALAHSTLAIILILEARPQYALTEIEKEPSDWLKLTNQALAYHVLGRGQDSNAALAELIAKYNADSAYQIAQVYAFRGESGKSFEWLERAYRQRDPGLPAIKIDPLLKTLRQDRRFAQLLDKMRLPKSSS